MNETTDFDAADVRRAHELAATAMNLADNLRGKRSATGLLRDALEIAQRGQSASDGAILKPDPRKPLAGEWLQSLSSAERKEAAVSRGLFAYFPDALALIARHSVRSGEKHHPGQPVHWERGKSDDHEDCVGRHSLAIAVDPNSLDDGQPHIICRAWRALAALQVWAEEQLRKERPFE